jgi:hypothetical protein
MMEQTQFQERMQTFLDGVTADHANPMKSEFYRVFHIGCSTVRHERGCAACQRREQGKTTLRRLASVKTRLTDQGLFPVPFLGKNDVKLGRLESAA